MWSVELNDGSVINHNDINWLKLKEKIETEKLKIMRMWCGGFELPSFAKGYFWSKRTLFLHGQIFENLSVLGFLNNDNNVIQYCVDDHFNIIQVTTKPSDMTRFLIKNE